MKYEISTGIVEMAEKIGIEVSEEYDSLEQLKTLLPENYLFIEQKLWCGDTSISMGTDYNYANAIIKMAITLHYEKKDIPFNYGWS